MRTQGSSLRHDPVSMSDARRAFAANPVAAFLATGFGSGLSPIAPGTAGSLVGLGLAWLLSSHTGILGSPVGLLMSGLAVGLLGVAVSGPVCRALSSEDPGCIVIDEVAGQMITCAAIPWVPELSFAGSRVWVWVAAFVLFRAFDVVKPLGIRRIQALPGGWGVVVDDVLAGLYAAAVLVALGRWV
jgi:phosphatidylglycerophosphatase A